MVELTPKELSCMMACKNEIRNVSVIGHTGHGKSTLTRLLETTAGSIAPVGDVQLPAKFSSDDMTLMSTGTYIRCELAKEKYLITLLDSPGHVELSSEVTAALRITDGALIVADCYEGVCLNTEMVIQQALSEAIIPVLTINKIDRYFLEHRDGEEVFTIFKNVIDNANVIMSGYKNPLLGDVMVQPSRGTVAFASGKHGWAFTLADFASMFAGKVKLSEPELTKRLWGDHFYDSKTGVWTEVNSGTPSCKRGFVEFCYNPIMEVVDFCLKNDIQHVEQVLNQFGVTLEREDMELKGENLMKRVMQKWLPPTSLLEMMISHLPSPPCAQKRRVKNLYGGPQEDTYARAIRNCDSEGPLMIYVSKMIPSSHKGLFFAFGRVFAGKISHGLKVNIMGPNYIPGKTQYLYEADIQMEKKLENVENVACGNIVALYGLDECITKNATLTSCNLPDDPPGADPICALHPIRAMKFYVCPVLRVKVSCKSSCELAKGLMLLDSYDLMVVCTMNGKHTGVIAVAGELHLRKCVSYLIEKIGKIQVHHPVQVVYCETVLEESSRQVMSRSPNMLKMDMRSSTLLEDGVCCFDPEKTDPRVQFEYVKSEEECLKNIRDYVKKGFELASQKGALAEENMRGIRFKFKLCKDGSHSKSSCRESKAITSLAERVVRASQLSAKPRLLQPIYLAEILVAEQDMPEVYSLFNRMQGAWAIEEYHMPGVPFYHIKAFIPVVESIGLSGVLKNSKAYLQCVIDHWSVMEEDPFVCDSRAAKIVRGIRAFKGLEKEIPDVSQFEDKP